MSKLQPCASRQIPAAYTATALAVKFTAPSVAVCAAPALAVERIAPALAVFRCMVKQRL